MSYKNSEKRSVILAAQKIFRESQIAELKLRFTGDVDAANRMWAASTRLHSEIDILLGEAFADWAGQPKTVIAKLKKAAADVKKETTSIKKTTDNMKKAVKIAGYLDTVIEQIAKLLIP